MSQSKLPPSAEVKESDFVESTGFSQVLGAGSFGVVLKTKDTPGATCSSAVKIIFPKHSRNSGLKEREKILREPNAVLDKRHGNIVTTTNFTERSLDYKDIAKIFDGLVLEGQAHDLVAIWRSKASRKGHLDSIWIQMELCGHNLRSWLKLQKNLDDIDELHTLLTLQVGVVRGLVAGLRYLHQNKILHRDLKPENIYFSQGYLLPIKIGDFGLSREYDDDTSLTSQVGTYLYRASEAELRKYSFQADLYSLGLVVWEVLQLIDTRDRKNLFDQLVIEKNESVVHPHPLITNSKEIIINLTRRKVEERTLSLKEVRFKYKIVNFTVSNSQELRLILQEAEEGDIIELQEGEYEGDFDIGQNRIILWGKGEGTILRGVNRTLPVIRVRGNKCQVLSLKVISGNDEWSLGIDLVGSGNRLQDISFQGGWPSLRVEGYFNTLSNLSIANSGYGMWLVGSGNKVLSTEVKELVGSGFYIRGNENELDGVSCHNAQRGVEVSGNSNKVSNVKCHSNREGDCGGVIVWRGSGNLVHNHRAKGFSDYGLALYSDTSSSVVTDSVCDGVYVHGEGHKLVNVDGGEEIRIEGASHQLDSCRAKICINTGSDVILTESNFE